MIADFDGTIVAPGERHETKLSEPVSIFLEKLLAHEIPLYFATGRGDSIQSVLHNSLCKSFHAKVFVSYYSGSITRCLMEQAPLPEESGLYAKFADFLGLLRCDPFIRSTAQLDNKGYQLTLKSSSNDAFQLAANLIAELITTKFPGEMRMVQSSHSLDVIPWRASKLNCVNFVRERLKDIGSILTMGDRGGAEGNDYDMLTSEHSLSVDTVSCSLGSCWNILPLGTRNVTGFGSLFPGVNRRRLRSREFRHGNAPDRAWMRWRVVGFF